MSLTSVPIQQTRAGPQRTSSLDPTKTAKLLQKRPKHSNPDPATSLERKRTALNHSLSSSSSTTKQPSPSAPPYNASAPELHQPDDISIFHKERPSSAPLLPSHPPLSTRRNSRRIPRQHKLDRIDELDESNPLGTTLHHASPYDAIPPPRAPPAPEPKPVPAPEPVLPPPRVSPEPLPPTPPKPTDVLPAEPQGGMPLHLLPGQVLPKTILRSYQSQSAQYTHFAPPRIQLIHNQQQHLPIPPPLTVTNQRQPDFDPYAQFPLGSDMGQRSLRNHNQAPHRAHVPPRLRDHKNAHQPQRNMGPRMVQPMLVMPTPQRPPPGRLPPQFSAFDSPQPSSPGIPPPGLTLAQHMQPRVAPEEDAFAHLPAGILRMNTPSPPPAEPDRNPLLTPVKSTFEAGANLVRRQSLPLHAPQRAVAPPPNPVDSFFRQVKQTALPSVASAPMIAPFYQQEVQSASRSMQSLPTSHSHESLSRSEESSMSNVQLPTPPDNSPRGSRLMREDRLHVVGHEQTKDVTGLPTPESTPSPQPSLEEAPQVLEHPSTMRVVKGLVPGQSPVLADYMSVNRVHHYHHQSVDDEPEYEPEPVVHYARGELGHEPLQDDEQDFYGGLDRSYSGQSLQQTWSEMSEMGHERSYQQQQQQQQQQPSSVTDHTSTRASLRGSSRSRPRHVPKHLVMPAPLRQPTPVEDAYQEAHNAAASLLFSPPFAASKLSLLSSTPSHAPTTVTTGHQRNVLRKRASAVPSSAPLMPSNVPLTFPIMNTPMTGLRSTSNLKVNALPDLGPRTPRRLSKRRNDV